jgi:hypothetical protein
MMSMTPIVIARAVETCGGLPAQWDAWTADGQYLYLRYRHGIGTVNAEPSPDIATWTEDHLVAEFDTGDGLGVIELAEFCERAGLVLADGFEHVPYADYVEQEMRRA